MATVRERLEELQALEAQQPTVETVPARQRLEELRSLEKQEAVFLGASVIEPVRAVGSVFGRTVVGGIAGTLQALNPFGEEGVGAATVKEFQEGAFQPTTEAGRQGLETLGALVQKGIDIVNFPISGIGGLVELVSGQGLDQAVATITSTQDKGISTTAGQRVFEETGSPLAATLAEVAPEAILSAVGFKPAVSGIQSAVSGTGKAILGAEHAGKALVPAIKEAIAVTKDVSKAIFNFQTPTKQRIAKLLKEGSTDVDVARFKLEVPKNVPEGVVAPPKNKLVEFLERGGPQIKTDKVAISAIDQGFDEGVVAAIKGASPIDKTKLLKMVDIMEKAKRNKVFAQTNRPSDIAGNTLMERYKSIVVANKQAGKELDGVANSLRGQVVDFDPAVNSFISDLDSIGVSLTNDLKPIFEGSIIEGITGAEKAVTKIIKKMKKIKNVDGKQIHDLKRFIDEHVTFGKNIEGLAGRTEYILKSLRRNLDGILDEQFPEYDRVNTTFAKTIGAIESLQDVAGKKLNLSGPNAEKATGTLLRRLMGNAQSRVALLDSVNEIEHIARQFGGGNLPKIEGAIIKGLEGKSDLLTQILFADELDRVFGPVARTSFQGQIDQALKQGIRGVATKQGAIDLALTGAAKIAAKARGINKDGAFKAIKELLKESTP